MLNLIITRHGNTFDSGDIIRRVGLRTDIPLSNSGVLQCQKLAKYLASDYPTLSAIYCSELLRTKQSAQLISDAYDKKSLPSIQPIRLLNEVDYGLDDGKPEEDVANRLGRNAIDLWDTKNILPNGWIFNTNKVIMEIKAFALDLIAKYNNQTVLLVTSNGVARFFLSLIEEQNMFNKTASLKMATASVSLLQYSHKSKWQCLFWGKKYNK